MKKGFTLIELLVVVAIIGLLSSVVLSSLNSGRDKAANAAVKSNLSNIRAEAALFCGEAGVSCATVCSYKNIPSMMAAARVAGGGTASNSPCNSGTTAWAASAKLKNQEGANVYWCVDSTGISIGRINALASATVCPSS